MGAEWNRILGDLLYELHCCGSWKELTDFALERLHGFLRADRSSWNEFRGRGELGFNEWSKDARDLRKQFEPIISQFISTQNPLARLAGQGKKWDRGVRITDLVSQREFEKTELFNEGYKPSGARYQLAAQIGVSRFGFNAISFWRWDKDFSEEEQELLNLLLPHLDLVYERLMGEQRMREAFAGNTNSRGGSQLYFALDKDLYLRDAAVPLLGLFEAMPGFDGYRLPDGVVGAIGDGAVSGSAIEGSVTFAGKQFRVFAPRAGYRGYRYVSMTEKEKGIELLDTQGFNGAVGSLTKRQREIAYWIKRGKSNPEIAVILGISPRTVAKHVENIFRELGVESRYSFIANF